MKIDITVQPNTTLNNKTGGWRTYKPETDLDKCISCGICALVCPEGCVTMEKIKNYDKEMPITNYGYCKGCGVCAEECPVKCIEMGLEKK